MVEERRRKRDVVYLEVRRAFDSVSHHIVMDKLMKYWLKFLTQNWLNCQAEQVVTNNKRCSWRPVTGGLPQRSILEPRITSSLMTCTTEYTHGKFHNNTKLEEMADTPDGHATIQADVDRLEKWTNQNLMKFKGKCQVLHLRKNNPKHQNLGQPLGKQLCIKGPRARKANSLLDSTKQSTASRLRRGPFPSTQHWRDPICSDVSNSLVPSIGQAWTY